MPKPRRGDCPRCNEGTMQSSELTVTHTKGSLVLVIRRAPGHCCTHCGEEVLSAAAAKRIEALAARLVAERVSVDVRDY